MLLAILFLLIQPVWAEDLTEIRTPEELLAIADNPSGNYVLLEDLDMTGVVWVPFDFYGTLEGNGHGILNLSFSQTGQSTAISYDGNLKEYDTRFAGMFCKLENARIQNLELINVRGLVTSDEPCFVGSVAGYSRDSLISGCRITGCLELRAHDRMFGVGGVVGYGTGDVTNCAVDMTLICTDTDAETKDEQFLGGIFATGFMGVEACQIQIDGYDSDHGYVHNGGITGMLMQYPIGLERFANLVGNTIDGKITFFEDNGDRRAYCSATVGELIQAYRYRIEGNVENFLRDERREYDRELRPEMCGQPDYGQTVVLADCTNWGYTQFACSSCGYVYRDCYTPHFHRVTAWQITEAPTADSTGISVGSCDFCGIRQQREEPMLPPQTESPSSEAEELPEESHKTVSPGELIVPAILLLAGIGFYGRRRK